MMGVVVDSVVSAFVSAGVSPYVSMVLERLKTTTLSLLWVDHDKEIQTLTQKLEEINEVLSDAERRGVTDLRVKRWLDELQEIAYDIDYACDEWEVEKLRRKYQEEDRSYLQPIKRLRLSDMLHPFALQLKHINERLETIAKRNEDEFKFIPHLSRDPQVSRPIQETTSFIDVNEVYGRDLAKKDIISKLTSRSSDDGGSSSSHGENNNGLQIISIVGAGGMGKTTLAQLVLQEVECKFDVAKWIYVSDPFDQIKVAKKIFEALNNQSTDVSNLDTLLKSIRDSLKGKKFLLVLDDVWTEDYNMWEPFHNFLHKSGSPGSRVLVTTRKRNVAEDVMRSAPIHELGRLSEEDCWLVLSQRAFHGRTEADRAMLTDVGKQIARKCNGMPLAARMIGSLLYRKKHLEEWENVLESEWWKSMRKDVFPSLALSYEELDPEVKRCFSFCAIFLKGDDIEVEPLIRIWMAQGFLTASGKVTMEQQGRDYFNDLAVRSFFQDYQRDKRNDDHIISFRMHDVVRDFAQSLTKSECVVAQDQSDDGVSLHNVRHLNLQEFESGHHIGILSKVSSKEKLHSLLLGDCEVPSNLFSELKRVRWLSLNVYDMRDIPPGIETLIHLRLLDLSHTDIIELPSAICELYNLQTLDLSHCEKLSRLPDKIERLTNLRHLLNEKEVNIQHMYPEGFKKLTSLQTLETYCCDKLSYLKCMNQLRGSLKIVTEELSEFEAEEADLKSKEFIRKLTLDLGWYVGSQAAIDALQPHQNLQELDLSSNKIPSWLTDNLTNLRRLTLKIYEFPTNWSRDSCSPRLDRLPFLNDLSMSLMSGMERIDNEFLGINISTTRVESFPKLKSLFFHGCNEWKEWEDISEEEYDNNEIAVMPCLEELVIKLCSRLKSLPHRLLSKASSLKLLRIIRCPLLRRRYDRGYEGDEKDEWDPAAHIPRVEFTDY